MATLGVRFLTVPLWMAAVAGIALANEGELRQARQLEAAGNPAQARTLLRDAARASSATAGQLLNYAEFLDRRHDPEARAAYERALKAVTEPARKQAIARRLVALDLLANDRAAATRHLADFREAGGQGLSLPEAGATAPTAGGQIEIPGPIHSFSRMAALSPDLKPEELLGALARNVVTNGYQAGGSQEGLEQTEYLKLVVRYLSQARELEKLAGDKKVIAVEQCESPVTGDLLKVLGYRMRGGCGAEVVLETVNASRAFLTIDSGFPLAELEAALRANKPFHLGYKPTVVPVLYGQDYWLGARDKGADEKHFVDAFLADPQLCRLYLGLSKLDPDTAAEMRKSIPSSRLRAFAHVLDFYGGMFQVRDGRAVTPGGARAEKMWGELAGAPPEQGVAFYEKLLTRDDGWLASYYDSLMRITDPVQGYLTEPERLKRFYTAIRGRITSPGPARPVFRANTDMLLLTTRLRLESDDKPHIPGGIETWRNLFTTHPHGKYDGKLTKAATSWKEPDDVVEALFALSRKAVENEPLKMYMMLSDINRRRAKPLERATVDRMLLAWRPFASQYSLFTEAPTISDRTILQFLDDAKAVNDIRDPGVRSDVAGMYQSLLSLWQIFTRQGLIPEAQADAELSDLLTNFARIKSSRDLFDAARTGVEHLMKAAGLPTGGDPQQQMMNLLAGQANPKPEDEAHAQLVAEMTRIFEAQRLISLKTVFDLADNLESLSKGEKMNTALINRLAARILEIQPPRTNLSGAEKNAIAFGYWVDKHIDSQRKVNFRSVIEKAASDPEKLREARGLIAQFLRDTLVGYVYIHYAPPGAQILLTNPVFVRSHDFIGIQGANQTWRQTEVFGTGWPASAGGRLVGSLAGLPYALAEAEQNFLIPTREQALIWGDLVPQLMLTAKVPRWWNVTPGQMHWLALHVRAAETALAESVAAPEKRQALLASLNKLANPLRVKRVADALAAGNLTAALEQVTPAELYAIGAELAAKAAPGDPVVAEIQRLAKENPAENNHAAISKRFGTPKPTLAASYSPELLNLRTFPTLMGYSSRILAESWESNVIYYATLADELDLRPADLNVQVPHWTRRTVERIFATHLEDWPALLRSLRWVGDEVRAAARTTGTSRAGLE